MKPGMASHSMMKDCLTALIMLVFAAGLSFAQETAKTEAAQSYVGPDACKACHSKTHGSWMEMAHGKALSPASLPKELRGCEACHGPAGEHISGPAENKMPSLAKLEPARVNELCGKCHFSASKSAAPGPWRTMDGDRWLRREHARAGLSCLSCHNGHSDAANALKKTPPALCLDCHSDVLSSGGKRADYNHMPVAQGLCLKCHDPHSGDPHLTRPGQTAICQQCHASSEKFNAAHKGMPAAGSQCIECHDPHSHDPKSKLVRAEQHTPFKGGNCAICHTAGGNDVVLKSPEKELCTSCHSRELIAPAAGRVSHYPVQEGACTQCHSAHVGDRGGHLLKDEMAYLCFRCHGRVEASVNSEYHHKPVDDLKCGVCHKPHSAEHKGLLVKEQMSLCLQCHKQHDHPMGIGPDKKPVIDPTTGGMLACSSCHEPHGSRYQMLAVADHERELCIKCHKVGHS